MKKIISYVFSTFCFALMIALDLTAKTGGGLAFELNLPVSSGELFVIIGVTGAVAALLIIGIVVFTLFEKKIEKQLEDAGYVKESKGQIKEEKRVVAELEKYEKETAKALAEKEKAEKNAPIYYDNTVVEAAPEEEALNAKDGGEFDFDMGQAEETVSTPMASLDEDEFDMDLSETEESQDKADTEIDESAEEIKTDSEKEQSEKAVKEEVTETEEDK